MEKLAELQIQRHLLRERKDAEAWEDLSRQHSGLWSTGWHQPYPYSVSQPPMVLTFETLMKFARAVFEMISRPHPF